VGALKPIDINDLRHKRVWLRREQALYALGVSLSTLRKYETRPEDPLPRHKSPDAQGAVRYDLRDICVFYAEEELRKARGQNTPQVAELLEEAKAEAIVHKARLTKAQAEAQEIKNHVARGELVPIQALEDALSDVCGQISAMLGALPSKLRKKFSWLKSAQLADIESVIAKAQNAAAEVQVRRAYGPDDE